MTEADGLRSAESDPTPREAAMGVEYHYIGTVTIEPPVPVTSITDDLARLTRASNDRFDAVVNEGHLTGIHATADHDGSARSFVWEEAFAALTRITQAHCRTVTVDMTWQCDAGPADRGTVVVDEGFRFHDVLVGDDTADHLARRCECLILDSNLPRTTFAIAKETPDPAVTVSDIQLGPFTEFQLGCTEHGAIDTYASRRHALYRREEHLQRTHSPAATTATPDATAITDQLPQGVRDLLDQAAQALRDAGLADPNAVLLQALIERKAGR